MIATLWPFCGQPVFQPLIQSVAESIWQIKHGPSLYQLDDVASALYDCGAVAASLEMGFQASAQFWAHIVLQIIGDFAPHFFATDLNYHGYPPLRIMTGPRRPL